MKKLLGILVLGLFLITPSQAEDIRDFEIEGMSIGDSLLDYFSEKKIIDLKNSYPDNGYIYKSRSFYSLTFWNIAKFEKYDGVQLNLKDDDKNYIIYAINGLNNHKDIEKCYSMFDSIEEEFDIIFKNSQKVNKDKRSHVYDDTGESTTTDVYYYFDDGSYVAIVCTDWSDDINKSNSWSDTFRVELGTIEIVNFLKNEAY